MFANMKEIRVDMREKKTQLDFKNSLTYIFHPAKVTKAIYVSNTNTVSQLHLSTDTYVPDGCYIMFLEK